MYGVNPICVFQLLTASSDRWRAHTEITSLFVCARISSLCVCARVPFVYEPSV